MPEQSGGMNREEWIRLNKYLADMGVCSRREADRLIEAGEVTVDGKCAVPGQKIRPEQKVVCCGKIISGKDGKGRAQPVWLVVNKPRGIVCTTSHKDQAETIVDMVKYPSRVYPVGRLDKDSEGLILMTNQGDLVNKIMRSGNAHEKEYLVSVDRPVTKEFCRAMEKGIWLEELKQTTRPCRLKQEGEKSFRIILTQGLNRQIRRMCQALGYQVVRLKRVRIMNIHLGSLKTGAWRKMTQEEYREMTRLLKESGATNQPYRSRMENGRERNKEADYE